MTMGSSVYHSQVRPEVSKGERGNEIVRASMQHERTNDDFATRF